MFFRSLFHGNWGTVTCQGLNLGRLHAIDMFSLIELSLWLSQCFFFSFICFVLVLVTYVIAQSLILVLCSEISPNDAWGLICNIGNQIGVNCIQGKHLSFFIRSPISCFLLSFLISWTT